GQTAAQAANTGRKSLEMTPQPPQTALKRQHRRSRRRCSDVPQDHHCRTAASPYRTFTHTWSQPTFSIEFGL
ncbi:hypothetical protein, partial [Phaeobacter sp. CAU 1743]|uniref:hypothetical protein n=1 Tax=Phaeobacter sp. CAU 1743 TaxID=3140367 RepID=UPI00325AFF32